MACPSRLSNVDDERNCCVYDKRPRLVTQGKLKHNRRLQIDRFLPTFLFINQAHRDICASYRITTIGRPNTIRLFRETISIMEADRITTVVRTRMFSEADAVGALLDRGRELEHEEIRRDAMFVANLANLQHAFLVPVLDMKLRHTSARFQAGVARRIEIRTSWKDGCRDRLRNCIRHYELLRRTHHELTFHFARSAAVEAAEEAEEEQEETAAPVAAPEDDDEEQEAVAS